MLLDLITVVVLAFFGSRLIVAFRRSLRGDARSMTGEIVRGLRPRHFLPVPFVLAGVIATAYALIELPLLSFGWWTAVGGSGNPVFGSSERTTNTVFEWLLPLVFVMLLLPALPLFALREEEIFRRGAEFWSWPKRAARVMLFGFVHALIGIPIGVALALSVGGAYFMFSYLRGYRRGGARVALLEAARAHTAYNATVVLLVLISLPSIATA